MRFSAAWRQLEQPGIDQHHYSGLRCGAAYCGVRADQPDRQPEQLKYLGRVDCGEARTIAFRDVQVLQHMHDPFDAAGKPMAVAEYMALLTMADMVLLCGDCAPREGQPAA